MPYTRTEASAPAQNEAFAVLATSFRRHLAAENKAPKTLTTYLEAVRLLGEFLVRQGMPTAPASITREHLEMFIGDLLTRHKPATANNRYRALQAFFKWLVDEGEIDASPMARMHPPHVPEEPPAILTEAQIDQLLRTCDGKTFEDRRDTAIIRLFMDSGMRRAELARLAITDVDLDSNLAVVLGKGRRPRVCPFGAKTARAIDRYLRSRAQHRDASRPELWLGHAGPMTDNGIYQVIRDRAEAAGLGKLHPHQLRHTFAHRWLSAGGGETDLMRLAGWRSRSMVGRYGASAADERAREAHKRLGLGEKV